jgi:hypothetical protein
MRPCPQLAAVLTKDQLSPCALPPSSEAAGGTRSNLSCQPVFPSPLALVTLFFLGAKHGCCLKLRASLPSLATPEDVDLGGRGKA